MKRRENKRNRYWKRLKVGDQWLMRRENGDDNGDNGSHAGPDGHIASSSLALETPSAGWGKNASKWPLFSASKHYNSGVWNLLILPTLLLLDIASDAFCCRLCYILSCSKIKDGSARARLMDWIMIKGKTWLCSSWHTPLTEPSVGISINGMKWTGKMTEWMSEYTTKYLLCEGAKRW